MNKSKEQEGVPFSEKEFLYALEQLREGKTDPKYFLWAIAEMVQKLQNEIKQLKHDIQLKIVS